jgi:hypothetical protein
MILLNANMELTMIYVLIVAHSFVEHLKRPFNFFLIMKLYFVNVHII